jgi:hypothetical protein
MDFESLKNPRKTGNRGKAFRFLSLFLLLMTLPGVARADLKVSVQGVGHSHLSPYAWTRVTVENPDAQAVGFKLTGNVSYYSRAGQTNLTENELGPGAQRTYDLPMLGKHEWGNYFSVLINCMDSRGGRAGDSQSDNDVKMFLNIAPVSQWASEQQMLDFSDAIEHPEKQQQGPPEPEKTGAAPSASVSYMGTYPGSTKKSNFISQIEPIQLPDNWLCYTPFLAVMVGSDTYKTLPAEVRTALTRWVNTGGHLIVYGASESRTEYHLLGKIEYRTGPVLTALDQIPQEWKMSAGGPPSRALAWTRYSQVGGGDLFPFLVKLDALGRSGGLILATIFCIVAGPVNYFYCRRKNRIRMLMLSLPAFSIAFCLLITGYFLATKGFSRKGGTFSISILDEGADSAVTFSRHLLFSGLYPLGGFTFDRETAFFPMEQNGEQQYDMTLQTQQRRLTMGMFIPQVPSIIYSHDVVTRAVWCTHEAKNRSKRIRDPIQAPRCLPAGFVYGSGAIQGGQCVSGSAGRRSGSDGTGPFPFVEEKILFRVPIATSLWATRGSLGGTDLSGFFRRRTADGTDGVENQAMAVTAMFWSALRTAVVSVERGINPPGNP